MSYGYLVASTIPIPGIEKHRKYKFTPIESSHGFYVYSRLEESNDLIVRKGDRFIFTPGGAEFFSSIPKPFFFMHYLLANKQGEADMLKLLKSKIKACGFEKLCIISGKELSLNCIYEVAHDCLRDYV